jgi:hypothetical protein
MNTDDFNPSLSTRSPIDFPLPYGEDAEALTGAIFSESTGMAAAGDYDKEKDCVGLAIINAAYYATWKPNAGATCFNSSFGNGTIIDAVRRIIVAYGKARWKLIMTGDRLKSKAELEAALTPPDADHLKRTVNAVNRIYPSNPPVTYAPLSRVPLQFNQAIDSPPNPQRQEKVGRYASHTFYAFKKGRECQ